MACRCLPSRANTGSSGRVVHEMTNNVIGLDGVPLPGTDQLATTLPEMIALLEDAVRLAKIHKIVAVGIIMLAPDGQLLNNSMNEPGHDVALIGAIDLLQDEVRHEMRKRLVVIETTSERRSDEPA